MPELLGISFLRPSGPKNPQLTNVEDAFACTLYHELLAIDLTLDLDEFLAICFAIQLKFVAEIRQPVQHPGRV